MENESQKEFEKKRKIAYVLTIVTLANLWASLAVGTELLSLMRGATTMVTIFLIGITIERWARVIKAYIDLRLEENDL